MRTFFSYIIIFMFIAFCVPMVLVERFFDEVTDTKKITAILQEGKIYSNLVLLVGDVLQQKMDEKLKGTSLEISEEETRETVVKTFPEDWFMNSIDATHHALMEYLDDPQKMPPTWVGLILKDKKGIWVGYMMKLLDHKLDQLPVCNKSELRRNFYTQMAYGKSTIDLKKIIPPCQPPTQIKMLMMAALEKSLDQAMAAVPDTVNLLNFHHRDASFEAHAELKDWRSFRLIAHRFTFYGYAVLMILMLILVMLNYSDFKKLLFRAGLPCIVTGCFLLVAFGFLYNFFSNEFILENNHFDPVAISSPVVNGTLFNAKIVQLFIPLFHVFGINYSWHIALLGGLFVGLGILLWMVGHFGIKGDS